MLKLTTKQRVLDFMKYRDWTNSGAIQAKASEWFTTGSTVARRCRELEDEGKLYRRINGGSVEYKHPRAKEIIYSPEQQEARSRQGALL